ncbi:MAG: bifunctional methylenetetrahydrofolate dehydrogenase/methenyltetrahydrofolate cyclohydrolase FolD [Clostridia bacterium]|nr:bifunctional methylenetetrahydrofolate dehydrogenase/methenyltetrahydrofolate cyclohydrolase FolD [Clostridia bacterium]
MAQIIDGKLVSAKVREEIRRSVEEMTAKGEARPGLAVILVGEDPASCIYVRNKKKACEEVGFLSREYRLPPETKEEELLSLIDCLNEDDEIHGILVQLPVPKQISDKKVIARIAPCKDVDAFCFENVGRIMTNEFDLAPCTPAGIMELLSHYGIDPAGKNAVVIGRSNIVGKPMAMLLLHKNATVTICHSRTENLAEICRSADILVAAVGKAKFVTEDMVKEGAVVIDVGMNRDENGLCGDVDFHAVEKNASFITPVPGGVGPMTITLLLKNTLTAAKKAALRKETK